MSLNGSKRKHDDTAERQAHNLAVALKAAAAGLYVFAVDGASKRPLTRGWQSIEPADIEEAERLHWASVRASNEAACKRGEQPYEPDFVAYGATTSADRIKQIWQAFPDAMPAISLGPSKLGVVDGDNKATFHVQLDGETKLRTVTRKGKRYTIKLDGVERACMAEDDDLVYHDEARKLRRFKRDALRLYKANGAERVAEMLATLDLRNYPVTRTQSGGFHVFYSNDRPDPIKTNRGFEGFNVDVLGEGDQVLAPGAWRLDGACYSSDEAHVDLYETYEAGLILPPSSSLVAFGGLVTISQAATQRNAASVASAGNSPNGFEVDSAGAEMRFREYIARSNFESARHDALRTLAGRAGDFGLSCERTIEILLELNEADDETLKGKLFDGDALEYEDLSGFVERMFRVREQPIGSHYSAHWERSDGSAFGAVEGEDDENDVMTARATTKTKFQKASIMLDATDYHSNNRKIVRELKRHVPLYRRGETLVTVSTQQLGGRLVLPGQAQAERAIETSAFVPVDSKWLQARAAKHVDCRRTKAVPSGKTTTLKDVAAPPPVKECDLIAAAPSTYPIDEITRIADAPFMMASGEIISEAGFHADSRTHLTGFVSLPGDMPGEPTKDDAIAALGLIDELFDEFPFVDEASRSAALSLVLTLLARNLCDVVPLHAVSAPTPGTGKSELASIATRIALGRELPAQAPGKTEDELQKRLESALFAGHPVIALDNVNGRLSGDFLCQAVSQPAITLRLLGGNRMPIVENAASLVATGNNISFTNDMTRRVVMCRLDAGVERPETRTFKRTSAELKAHIRDNRAALIAAGLTIVRAYLAAVTRGETTPLQFAGFDLWSAWIRSPIVWAGRADPLDTQRGVVEDDPENERRAGIFASWHALTGGKAASVRDVLKAAERNFAAVEDDDEAEDDPLDLEADRTAAATRLRELIPLAPGRKGEDDRANALGLYFRRERGKVAGGLMLTGERDRTNATVWRTVSA